MEYLWKIKKTIMHSLYADTEKKLEKVMWQIAEENQKLVKGSSPTFFFNGRWWPIKYPNEPKRCNRFLHSSLYLRVQEILEDISNGDNLKPRIDAMISNFLAISGHTEDLDKLFPETLQHFIHKIDQEIFNIRKPLSKQTIKELLVKNEDNLRYLKRLLITQMLLNKA